MKYVKKVGILTMHYSNNYGGVLQAYALQQTIIALGYDVDIINYMPSDYAPCNLWDDLDIRRNIFLRSIKTIITMIRKIIIVKKHAHHIMKKFDLFRKLNFHLSTRVDEFSLESIVSKYDSIVVGSDQVWCPSARKRREYFLDFKQAFKGRKISYAADSTIEFVDEIDKKNLREPLADFDYISVRNCHTYNFVKAIIDIPIDIVADPTILNDFSSLPSKKIVQGDYIFMYVLGKEIVGTHEEAVCKIRQRYGEIPVYSVKIPTMKFELSRCADHVFYDIDPSDWLSLLKYAKFVYTDSFHAVLFSLKYHKPFLAYYTEELRMERFLDLEKRYGVSELIVKNVAEIDIKSSLTFTIDYNKIDEILKDQRHMSMVLLNKALCKSNEDVVL